MDILLKLGIGFLVILLFFIVIGVFFYIENKIETFIKSKFKKITNKEIQKNNKFWKILEMIGYVFLLVF